MDDALAALRGCADALRRLILGTDAADATRGLNLPPGVNPAISPKEVTKVAHSGGPFLKTADAVKAMGIPARSPMEATKVAHPGGAVLKTADAVKAMSIPAGSPMEATKVAHPGGAVLKTADVVKAMGIPAGSPKEATKVAHPGGPFPKTGEPVEPMKKAAPDRTPTIPDGMRLDIDVPLGDGRIG